MSCEDSHRALAWLKTVDPEKVFRHESRTGDGTEQAQTLRHRAQETGPISGNQYRSEKRPRKRMEWLLGFD